MDDVFYFGEDGLKVDEVSISRLAESVPTPFYVYGVSALVERFRALERAFEAFAHLHCVALKANSQPALLRPLIAEGAGAEVVSGAELALALALGFPPSRIVFSGVGKTERELRAGLEADIRMFLVESETELRVLNELAASDGRKGRVALRLNLDIDPGTHPHVATGVSTAKFGVDAVEAERLYAAHEDFAHLELVGIHSHIGSQITSMEPLAENARTLAEWVRKLRDQGVPLRYVDIGGGIGIPYEGEETPSFDTYAEGVIEPLAELDVEILTEPGRVLLGPVGAFIVRVLYVKKVHGRNFAVVDAGINDLIRPAFYNAYHRVVPVAGSGSSATKPVDIVGAVCESSDVFACNRELPELSRSDILAILDTGAYGFAMASNYNLRPRPAEVVVEGAEHRIVRAAETEKELVSRELGKANV